MQAEACWASPEDHSRYDRPVVEQAEAALEAAKLYHRLDDRRSPFERIVTRKIVHVGSTIGSRPEQHGGAGAGIPIHWAHHITANC